MTKEYVDRAIKKHLGCYVPHNFKAHLNEVRIKSLCNSMIVLIKKSSRTFKMYICVTDVIYFEILTFGSFKKALEYLYSNYSECFPNKFYTFNYSFRGSFLKKYRKVNKN